MYDMVFHRHLSNHPSVFLQFSAKVKMHAISTTTESVVVHAMYIYTYIYIYMKLPFNQVIIFTKVMLLFL